MRTSTLLRKETVIPAFAVSLILGFAFVMPGNAFRSNGDEQCGYGYGYGENDNEDQQGDNNDNQQGDQNDQGCNAEENNQGENETGNTGGDDNLSGGGDIETKADEGKTGGTHVASITKTGGEKHISAPAAKPAVVKTGDHEGDGDQGGSGSGGGDH